MIAPALVAVDGGGSKVDVALIARDGAILGTARMRPASANGADPGHLTAVDEALDGACRDARLDPARRPIAALGVYCLAGADLPADERRLRVALDERGWTRASILQNDTFAVLRAGTDRTWGVGVVCGYGTNCSAISPDGRTFRLPALGWMAGDWGGGADIGEAALWHAVRAEDGRGQRTALARAVPAYFGLKRPRQLMEAMYFGRVPEARVAELAPLVFDAATDGDPVATSIVERQGGEVVSMAGAAIRRLRMTKLDVHVVLGGGIFHNRHEPFLDGIVDGIRSIAPAAEVSVLTSPPVVGAALLGLDRLRRPKAVKSRVRAALTDRLMSGRRR